MEPTDGDVTDEVAADIDSDRDSLLRTPTSEFLENVLNDDVNDMDLLTVTFRTRSPSAILLNVELTLTETRSPSLTLTLTLMLSLMLSVTVMTLRQIIQETS